MTKTELIQEAIFMIKNYDKFPDMASRRLYHCKAWTMQSRYSKWIILQSYSTIVAAYDKNTEIVWAFDRYSVTTSQHVAKFERWLLKEMNPCKVKRVNLYNDSRTGKRAAKKNLDDDFASVIASALNQR